MHFWEKPLRQLDEAQWEALCDGCALCCLHKFEDADTGELLYTDVACALLDTATCRCRDYTGRRQAVPDCLSIRDFSDRQYAWLPRSCAYRLRFEGKPLPAWHPLLTGDPESVVRAGVSVRGRCVPEAEVPADAWEQHIIDSVEPWPAKAENDGR